MQEWKKCLVTQEQTITEAVRVIDSTIARIAVVVDGASRLVGTVTDYDVRQAILKGTSMDSSVSRIMNSTPKFLTKGLNLQDVLAKMQAWNVKQLPIVDDGVIVDLKLRSDFEGKNARTNPVLIMAGGLGTRLRPLTDTCPKPMLKLGAKPILQIILESFVEEGFNDFYFSVNYKAEMIKEYFGTGRSFGVNITYLEENKRLGTAGALSLLPDTIKEPVIVMNGDLLTEVDFHQLLEFHYNRHGQATMCVREYNYRCPYGVVKFDGWDITELREKPVYTEFVNAGIYVISPDMIKIVPKDKYYDMTDLFNDMVARKEKALIFPIRENWMDIGRLEDFERAKEEHDAF